MLVYLRDKTWNRYDKCVVCGNTIKINDSTHYHKGHPGVLHEYFDDLDGYSYCSRRCVKTVGISDEHLDIISRNTGLQRKK